MYIYVCMSSLEGPRARGARGGGGVNGGGSKGAALGGGLHGAGHIGGGHIGECYLGGGCLQQAGQEGRQEEVKTHLGVKLEELKIWKL